MAARTPKKAPAKAGAGRDIFDGHDRAEEARHVAALYAILPSDWTDPGAGSLPGLYRRQRALALEYLAPVAHVLVAEQEALRAALTPSQQAALALLEAVDRLLAAGAPDTPHKREWVRRVQAAAVLAHGRLHASSVERDKRRQAGTSKERRPEITEWLDEQLRRTPEAKSPELWRRAPDWITDQIGERRFAERVTRARKKRASK